GSTSLAWTLVPGLFFLCGLLLIRGRASHSHVHSGQVVSLTEVLHGRWFSTSLLLTVATLRVVPALGIPLTLAFWLDQQGVSETGIGQVQSLFLLSGSLGTLLCPRFLRPGREIGGMLWTTLPAAGCMLLLTA